MKIVHIFIIFFKRGALFVEKEVLFLNLEGRPQKTSLALSGPKLARTGSQILKNIFNLKKNFILPINKISNIFPDYIKNNSSFSKFLLLQQKVTLKKLFKSSLKISIANFYITNALTKNSILMAKSFSTQKQNYCNFI